MTGGLDQERIRHSLLRLGLIAPEDSPRCAPLAGGVSSDIWRIDHGEYCWCLKRALPQLKVEQVWKAPVDRNAHEWEWFKAVAAIAPDAVPQLVAQDAAAGLFVMQYLPPEAFPLWKEQLRNGIVDLAFAATVGAIIATIHAATAGRSAVAQRFATDDAFFALRLEPYLLATAAKHPDLAAPLQALAARTADTRCALVHGDVSPKNILAGPRGPIFLDAECAWYGDPAFDLAFCLNHLLLKCLWTPAGAREFLAAFDRLAASYLSRVTWEERSALEARAARLLPGLFLARVDGKSPVEYVTREAEKEKIRRVARPLISEPVDTLRAVRTAWGKEVGCV
jgi:aminoglycoside phosphotransferase (APT) family kinase protein